jgi:predicted secreted hydrolase
LDIPEAQLSLTITPRMRDQELRTAVAYWEGSVHVEGVREQQPVSGLGYVEMTGYDARLNAQN